MPADLDAGIREAFRLFRADLATYEVEVLRTVKVPLEPHEFDALVSSLEVYFMFLFFYIHI